MNQESNVFDLLGVLTDSDGTGYEDMMGQLQHAALDHDHSRHDVIMVECGNGPEEMSIGRAIANLAFLYPYRVAKVAPPPERFARSIIDSETHEKLLNAIIEDLHEVLDHNTLNLALASSLSYIGDIGVATTERVGTSVSIKGLFEAMELDPEIERLIYWKAPNGTFDEMERAADEAGAELNARLLAIPGEYGRLLRSGAAFSKDQLRQAFVSVGIKPGLMEGVLMSEPIDTSFLHGMRGVEDYYICAIGARKALATNYKQVKTSGYLSRKLVLLVADHVIDPVAEDCGTINGVYTAVQSHDHVKRLLGRYIATDDIQQWHIATHAELTSLIGSNIVLRSPITCANKQGEGDMCHMCYGTLAKSNKDIHAGIYGALRISEQITKRLLGSKHLLKARPVKINWPEEFLTHFFIDRTSIVAESTIDRIYIRADDIELDEDEECRTTSVFFYKVAGKQGRFKITTPVPIYLDADAWGDTEIDDDELALTPMPDAVVFQVPVSNTDLSEALNAIFNLIERDDLISLHDAYSSMIELLEKSQLATPSIHAEIFLRAMVRSSTDQMARPDFSGPEEPPYIMLKLKPAILNSPSVTNSLAFERVKAQLTSTEILRKAKPGVIDALFGG